MPVSANNQIELWREVGQSFITEQHTVVLFHKLSLTIRQGQSYAIVGPSGSYDRFWCMSRRESGVSC